MDLSVISSALNGIDINTLATLLGLGGVSSVVTQALKHWLDLQKEKVIFFLSIVIALLTVGFSYLIFAVGHNPALLGPETAIVAFLANVIYTYVVKPFYITLQNAKAYKTSIAAQNVTDAADKLAAAAPVIEPAIEKAIASAPATITSVKQSIETTTSQIKAEVQPQEFQG